MNWTREVLVVSATAMFVCGAKDNGSYCGQPTDSCPIIDIDGAACQGGPSGADDRTQYPMGCRATSPCSFGSQVCTCVAAVDAGAGWACSL